VFSACLDNINMVYGDDSAELTNFNHVIRDESKKIELEASKNQDNLVTLLSSFPSSFVLLLSNVNFFMRK
jgi:hypothetical protein